LSKPESWTEILVQPEHWIGSGCPTCPKSNPATTLIDIRDHSRFYREINKIVKSSICWWDCVLW
jgi:hypothetical protein